MDATILAACTYILWTMLLLLALALYRNVSHMREAKKSLKYSPSGSDLGELGQRITRAHANCYESAVFVLGPMLLALASGSAAITNGLALYMVLARILQSTVHLISTSDKAITIRFVLFLVQFVISAYWLIMLVIKFA